MILQALTKRYKDLAAQGILPRIGYNLSNVSYALELSLNGRVLRVVPLQDERNGEKKTKEYDGTGRKTKNQWYCTTISL